MMFRALYVLSVIVTFAACSNHSRKKRHLNWEKDAQYEIKSLNKSGVENIVVTHLKSHAKNAIIRENQNYLSFVLYKRNGAVVEPNGGVFHFIDEKSANASRWNCSRKTMHAGAYVYFYGKCPEEDKLLVASGYCYQEKLRGLRFDSYTFNQDRAYSDDRYYLNSNKEVHELEQRLLNCSYDHWKQNEFKTDWSCNFNDKSIIQCLAKVAVPNVANLDECNSCDQPDPCSAAYSWFNNGNGITRCVVMFFLSVSWKALLN